MQKRDTEQLNVRLSTRLIGALREAAEGDGERIGEVVERALWFAIRAREELDIAARQMGIADSDKRLALESAEIAREAKAIAEERASIARERQDHRGRTAGHCGATRRYRRRTRRHRGRTPCGETLNLRRVGHPRRPARSRGTDGNRASYVFLFA